MSPWDVSGSLLTRYSSIWSDPQPPLITDLANSPVAARMPCGVEVRTARSV